MASKEDIQFRCKLCQFTATAKQVMADHFMEIHAAVEIISRSSSQHTRPTKEEDEVKGQDADIDNNAAEESESSVSIARQGETTNKTPSKKKPGFRSNALRSTISHLVRAAEQASKEEWSTHSAETSTRARRIQQNSTNKGISKTIHAVGRELRKHKRKRQFDDFVVYDDDQPKNKQPKQLPEKGAGRKKSSPGKKASRKSKKLAHEKLYEGTALSSTEFKQKMDEELQLWSEKWTEENKALVETCDNANCNLQLSATEMKLHQRCHMKNYYGFKCPHCNYMHSRWRNMRCHIYDDHFESEKPLLECNWPGCSVSFAILWGLKRHVLRDHIRHNIIKRYSSGEEASSAETGKNDQTNGEEPHLSKPEEDADNHVTINRTRRRRKKKDKEIVDMGVGEEEAEKNVRNKKKFHRIAWLPSCSVCEAKYISIENMDSHIALHVVEGSDSIKCSECGVVVDDKSQLKAHMKEQHKRLLKVYRCELCKYAGDRHFDFKKHLQTHQDSKPCMCELCGKLMSTSYNLKVHILRVHATEEQKTILCQHCPYRCADKIVLKDHMRFQHNLLWNGDPYRDTEKLRSYKCSICSYVGRKETSLKYHMRVHTENRQFRCSLCCYASKTKNNLQLHLRTHGGMKPIKCPQCDYRGATNKVVNEHVLSKHKGVRPFRCPCGWSTAYSGNMWKHVQVHREKGDAFRNIATDRYGVPRSKKVKREDENVKPKALQPAVQPVITIVEEVVQTRATSGTLTSASQQPPTMPSVITFPEVPLPDKDIPKSSKLTQVIELPMVEEGLQLNNLVQAVSAVAADGDQLAASHQQTDDNQAATFLCKLAQAVSTGQQEALKQAPDTKGLQLACEVPVTSDGPVEQTIQELILW